MERRVYHSRRQQQHPHSTLLSSPGTSSNQALGGKPSSGNVDIHMPPSSASRQQRRQPHAARQQPAPTPPAWPPPPHVPLLEGNPLLSRFGLAYFSFENA